MNSPPYLTSQALNIDGVRHAFFGRDGGVSTGVFAGLNTGRGSSDDPEAVNENRQRCARTLGVDLDRLLTLYQIHSPNVLHIIQPWTGAPPQADAMVTTTPGIALGVLAADCMPFLFFDPEAKVIGAAHAGWRGALAGVLEATVAAMTKLGAQPSRILAALGPCLRQENFEVGLDLVEMFTEKYPASARFFAAGKNSEKRQLNLAAFGEWRLQEAGVSSLDDLEICTLAEPNAYFSYRASRRAGVADYGRNLSAIALSADRA